MKNEELRTKNEELEKLRSVFFDEADIILAIMDENFAIIDVNETLLRTFSFKREDVIGNSIKQISPDVETSGRIELYKEVLRTGKTIVLEEMKPHPSLGNFYFRIKVFKVGTGIGMVLKNITDLKNAIDELQTFIYKSSHDMRAPIASVLGIINLTNSTATTMEEASELRMLAKQQIEKLDSILSSLIRTQKIQIAEKDSDRIVIAEIIDEVFSSLQYTKGFNEISFEKNIEDIQDFYSDKQLLISVLLNLIDNTNLK